jgi:hypothetical protein
MGGTKRRRLVEEVRLKALYSGQLFCDFLCNVTLLFLLVTVFSIACLSGKSIATLCVV